MHYPMFRPTSYVFLLWAMVWGGSTSLPGQTVSLLPDSLQNPQQIDSTYLANVLSYSGELIYSNTEKALEIDRWLVGQADSIGDVGLKGRAYYGGGSCYTVMWETETALLWLDSAANCFSIAGDSVRFYNTLNAQGINYSYLGHPRRALSAYLKALAYFKRAGLDRKIARQTNNIGKIYHDQENPKLANEYYKEAYEMGMKVDDPMVVSSALLNIGMVYLDVDSLDLAEEYMQKGYDYNRKNELFFIHAVLCNAFAEVKIEQGKLDGVVALLEESEKMESAGGGVQAAVGRHWVYGLYYDAIGNSSAAIQAYDSVITISEREHMLDFWMQGESRLYQYHEEIGETKKAFEHYKQFIVLKDSMHSMDRASQMEELAAIHESEKKQQQIAQLKLDKELQEEWLGKQNWLITGLGLVLAAALVLLVFVFLLERRRRKNNQSLAERNAQIKRQQQEIVEKNETLAVQNSHLEVLNAEMKGLIEIVAHDLKSPISKSQALLSMIDNNDPKEETRQVTGMINRALDDGMNLIRDILTIRRAEEAGEEEKSNANIVPLVDKVIDRFKGHAEKKGIHLIYQPSQESIVVPSYPNAIERIMDNLISNALKFSEPESEVSVLVIPEEKSVSLVVQDQGPGISEEDQKQMFRKFQRLSARPTGGENSTGLGLSIVKALVSQLGGEINVNSTLGKGTRFTVELPTAK